MTISGPETGSRRLTVRRRGDEGRDLVGGLYEN